MKYIKGILYGLMVLIVIVGVAMIIVHPIILLCGLAAFLIFLIIVNYVDNGVI